MKAIRGLPASPGVAVGPVYLHAPEDPWIDYRRISEEEAEGEVRRFEQALEDVAADLRTIRAEVGQKLGSDHAQIFDAHLLILQDEAIRKPTIDLVQGDRVNAEYAFWRTFQKLRRQFEAIEDEFFRARKADILEIERRVLAKLVKREDDALAQLETEAIVIAHDLAPSDTAQLRRERVLGFVTEVGGTTSHAAIIARGLEIPAVVGVRSALTEVEDGDLAIVDGRRGIVYIDPDEATLARYQREASRLQEIQKGLSTLRDLPAVTVDGVRVSLQGNIELPEEVESVIAYGAEGIGLYRTEYLYLAGPHLPSEEDQTNAYCQLAERIAPNPLVVRTLDLGGDKLSHAINHMHEKNPFLGWRGIRLTLANEDLFKAQLRAILRASAAGNVRVMFPMISGVGELTQAVDLVFAAKEELRSEGVGFDEKIPVGAMIEVPSAAVVADQLAEEVDFFSIGTNDLIQYTIAVDRGNERVAYLYDPFHPAVLRLIKSVADAGHAQNVPVTLCGEMAGDPWACVLLLGLGVGGFSTSPRAVPEVKRAIRAVSMAEARRLAEQEMELQTSEQIRACLKECLPEGIREEFDEEELSNGEPGVGLNGSDKEKESA